MGTELARLQVQRTGQMLTPNASAAYKDKAILAIRKDAQQVLSARVVTSDPQIRRLAALAPDLMRSDEPTLDPKFFLASVFEGWAPRVVTVYKASRLIGITYTQERVIRGIPTGVIYADASLGNTVLADSQDRQDVFRVAAETLLASPNVRGLRLIAPRGSYEITALKPLIASKSFDVHCSRIKFSDHRASRWKYHAHLELPRTYEQFLTELGSTTRHNFRYYRRCFERSGHSFVPDISMDHLSSAVFDLAEKSKFKPSRMGLQENLKLIAASHRPLAIGLKHRDGRWMSVIAGWYQSGAGVLFFQCNNDFDFGQASLSTVLRGFLIESLIRQGLKELIVFAGTGPPLSRYVAYPPMIEVRLDAQTYFWRTARFVMSKAGPWLPRRLAFTSLSVE